MLKTLLIQSIQEQKSIQKIWILFSGGKDSTALLHALSELNLPFQKGAIHVIHPQDLSLYPKETEAIKNHCQAICQTLQMPLKLLSPESSKKALNPSQNYEAHARESRYEALSSFAKEGDLFLSAHHGGDQVEHLLMRLIRGSAPHSWLMNDTKKLGLGLLVRPWLAAPSETLLDYLKKHQLSFIDEPSKQDLRTQVRTTLQALKKLHPKGEHNMLRSLSFLPQNLVNEPLRRGAFPLDELSSTEEKRSQQLHQWLLGHGVLVHSSSHLSELSKQSFKAHHHASSFLWRSSSKVVYSFQGKLFIDTAKKKTQETFKLEPQKDGIFQHEYGRLHCQLTKEALLSQGIIIGFGADGKKIYQQKRAIKINEILRSWKIPPFQRAFWPVLYLEEGLDQKLSSPWVLPTPLFVPSIFQWEPYDELYTRQT